MKNVVLIVLDSCRYDAFEKANATFLKSFGNLYKCYSPACWTIPSLTSLAFGIPPLNSPIRANLFNVKNFKQKQILTPNPLVISERTRIFKGFNVEGLKYDYLRSSASIFKDAEQFLEQAEEPFYLLMLLMETHAPFWDGKKTYGHPRIFRTVEEGVSVQARCVEHIDQNFKKYLYDSLTPLKNTRIIITADHGEGMGDETQYGKVFHHNLTQQDIYFHPKLFEIPFIIKDL